MKEFTIEATKDNLNQVIKFVDAELEANDCSMKAQLQLDVAVEEMYINVASYAYAPDVGNVTIQVDFADGNVSITFIDSGVPFNPLDKPDPDVTLSAAERQIGGLGIYMVKKSMDDFSYLYKDGQNISTVKKKI